MSLVEGASRAGSGFGPGLVALKQQKARQIVYGKLRTQEWSARKSRPETVESALRHHPIGLIPAAVELAVQNKELNAHKLFQILGQGSRRRMNLGFERAVAIAAAWQTHSGRKLQPRHYGVLMTIANREYRWLDAMHVFGLATHRPAFGRLPESPSAAVERSRRDDNGGLFGLVAPEPIQPSSLTYAHLLRACRDGLRWRHALMVLRTMQRERVVPNGMATSMLLSTLRHSSKWHLALSAFDAAASITPEDGLASDNESNGLEQGSSPASSDSLNNDERRSDDDDTALFAHLSEPVRDDSRRAFAEYPTRFEPTIDVYRELISTFTQQGKQMANAWFFALRIIGSLAATATSSSLFGSSSARLAAMEESAEGVGASEWGENQDGSALEDAEVEDSAVRQIQVNGEVDGEAHDSDSAAKITSGDDAVETDHHALDVPLQLSVLPAPTQIGGNGLNAGLTNAALLALARAGEWERGVEVFLDFTRGGAVTSTVATAATMKLVAALAPKHVEHQQATLAHAFGAGLTVSAGHYATVFQALCGAGRSDEALALFYKLYDAALEDIGNLALSLGELYGGMLRCLLRHAAPDQALVMAAELEGSLDGAVAEDSARLVGWGDSSQLWTAEGRVAVIDASVLHGRGLENLADEFDNVVIPYGELLEYLDEANAPHVPAFLARRYAAEVHYLQRLCTPATQLATSTPFRVLPFIHQLSAAATLQTVAEAALEARRQAAEAQAALPAGGESAQQRRRLASSETPLLAADAASLDAVREAARAAAVEATANDRVRVIPVADEDDERVLTVQPWTPAGHAVEAARDDGEPATTTGRANAPQQAAKAHREHDYVKRLRVPSVGRWLTAPQTPRAAALAAAVMLHRANPDAEVVLVTRERPTVHRLRAALDVLRLPPIGSGAAGAGGGIDAHSLDTVLLSERRRAASSNNNRRAAGPGTAEQMAELEALRRADYRAQRAAFATIERALGLSDHSRALLAANAPAAATLMPVAATGSALAVSAHGGHSFEATDAILREPSFYFPS